jgi:hypothetical protein
MLSQLPKGINYEGLKACNIIYSNGIVDLDDQAKLYAKGELSVVDPKFLDIFLTIKEYYLVSKLLNGWVEPSLLPAEDVIRLW